MFWHISTIVDNATCLLSEPHYDELKQTRLQNQIVVNNREYPDEWNVLSQGC